MKFLQSAAEIFSRWIDCVTDAVVAAGGWFAPARAVALIEETAGVFAVRSAGTDAGGPDAERLRIVDGKLIGPVPAALADKLQGSRAELVLQPGRFMFRPLELPRRASDFLDGIVRAQIDRLTPWSAADAAFGWSAPSDIGNDRMVLTVAATARALIAPLVDTVSGFGVNSISVCTVPPDSGAAAIKVFEQKLRGALDVGRVRRGLVAALLVAGLLAGTATTASIVIGGDLQARQDDIASRIAARRASLRANLDAGGNAALTALERRKHQTPSSVIVLEALSQILPDHTYVTELRIVGDTMQIVGLTRDAPLLIRLIEQNSHFTRATFFAPTTRAPSQSGEQFHIEARIEPIFTPRT